MLLSKISLYSPQEVIAYTNLKIDASNLLFLLLLCYQHTKMTHHEQCAAHILFSSWQRLALAKLLMCLSI